MPLPKETAEYVRSQIDYYIQEAGSYRQIAEVYAQDIDSVTDAAFGIITGCVYSAFLQALPGPPSLEDVREFNQIMKGRVAEARAALKGMPRPAKS